MCVLDFRGHVHGPNRKNVRDLFCFESSNIVHNAQKSVFPPPDYGTHTRSLHLLLSVSQGTKAFDMLLRLRLRGVEKDPRLVAVLAALAWVCAICTSIHEMPPSFCHGEH